MRTISIASVRGFLKKIEASIDLTKLKLLMNDALLAKRLIDRLEEINTLCETFEATLKLTEHELDPNDVDQAELIRMRDRGNNRELRFVAGYLLKLTHEVRYPNKEGS